jgi:esterase/lipase superfamily enzyme
MKIEYHSWWSHRLGQEMGLKVYGYYGKPVLVFPAQGGRFYEFEDFGMVEAAAPFIEAGQVKLFTVDSVDNQSWANWGESPYQRAWRHEDYDGYITEEVVPFIRQHCAGTSQKFWTTGCSMGAYQAANFFFRHPEHFDGMIALSGIFQLNLFVGDYMDERVYLNSPLHYLPRLEDPWYLDQYRKSQIIVCVGRGAWEEPMLAETHRLKEVLASRQIPAWIDFWGEDVSHDWPWWRKMLPYFLGELSLPLPPQAGES